MLQSKAAPCPRRVTSILFALILFASLSRPAVSQTYKVIYNFTGQGSDGATPDGGPILDRNSNLFGTTYLGGAYGSGSVYRLSPHGSSWVYTSLYSLKGGSDGAGPAFGSLAIGPGHRFFGTTEGGGNFGTVFDVWRPANNSLPWKESVVHSFGTGTDGAQPIGGVVFDSAGNFYGTTSLGGDTGNGAVFEVKRSGNKWIESVIYSFKGGTDAFNPVAGVTLGAHGVIYGTTSFGGKDGDGTVYRLQRSGSHWKETILYSFKGGNDGQHPVGGVILDSAGNLYGSTFQGGANGGGTVYRLSHSSKGWKLTTGYSFNPGFGGPYNKLTLDASGNIYGTTNGDGANNAGSVFKLRPKNGAWEFTDLYDFTDGTDGGLPYGALVLDAQGNIFGTAVVGGTDNQGVVFEIIP